MRTHRRALVVAVGLALLATACGGSSDKASAPKGGTTSTTVSVGDTATLSTPPTYSVPKQSTTVDPTETTTTEPAKAGPVGDEKLIPLLLEPSDLSPKLVADDATDSQPDKEYCDGESFKAFSTLDGQGLKLLAQAGIVPIVVTGRDSPGVRRRVSDLGLAHAAYGVADKLAASEALLAGLGVDWSRVAVIGDDWPDLPLMQRAAFACAPPGAHVEARAAAHHVTTAAAGFGAAREFCDLLLVAAGRYARLLHGPLRSLDGAR